MTFKINTDLNDFLNAHHEVTQEKDYDIALKFWTKTTPKAKKSRLQLYHQYQQRFPEILTETAAKKELLSLVFGPFIQQQLQQAQRLCASSPPQIGAADTIIQRIQRLSVVFKAEYDESDLLSFVCDSSSMTPDEAQQIFTDLLSPSQINIFQDILGQIQKAEAQPHSSIDTHNWMSHFNAHPLTSFFKASRIHTPMASPQYGEYQILAEAISQYREVKHQEQVDGLLLYLITLDLNTGLNQAREPAVLVKMMNKIKQKQPLTLDDLDQIAIHAQQQSQNFIVRQDLSITHNQNQSDTGRAVGTMDRRYVTYIGPKEVNIHLHTANRFGEHQNNQAAIAWEASKRLHSNNSTLVIQVAQTNPFYAANKIFLQEVPLAESEQVCLSFMKNFTSFLTETVSLLEQNQNPHFQFTDYNELYTDNLSESTQFMDQVHKATSLAEVISAQTYSIMNIIDRHDLLSSFTAGKSTVRKSIEFFLEPYLNLVKILSSEDLQNLVGPQLQLQTLRDQLLLRVQRSPILEAGTCPTTIQRDFKDQLRYHLKDRIAYERVHLSKTWFINEPRFTSDKPKALNLN